MRAAKPDSRITNLFENHYDEVLAFCVRRIGESEAQDVAAEVFAVAWRRLDEIEKGMERAWLFGIARRVLANRWRSVKRQSRLAKKASALATVSGDSPDVLMVRREQDNMVIETVRKLKVDDQEVLMLAGWEGLTAREIGLVLDLSTAAVEQRIHRAKKRLATALAPLLGQFEGSPRAAHEEEEADVS